jgi:hypothetical protein
MAASNEWQVLTESHGHLPHLLVIPENAANRDIVAGFRNHLSVDFRRIQVVNVAGGVMEIWSRDLIVPSSVAGTMEKRRQECATPYGHHHPAAAGFSITGKK